MNDCLHDNARLILVFRPLKTATKPTLIRGSEHYYLDYKSKNHVGDSVLGNRGCLFA
jgi:hypothetical protein